MSKALRILNYIAIVIVSGSVLTSCFDDPEYDEVNYNDLIISNIAFGTLPRLIHTVNKAGGDSTYNSTVSATSAYPFTIDQVNNIAYNLDSLPYGTRADKIIFSTFTIKDGSMTIKLLDSDKDTLYTAKSDTLDFSRGYREFNLYGLDGTSRRTYRVEVRIHQQMQDSLTWTPYTLEGWNSENVNLGATTADYSVAGSSFRMAEGAILTKNADGEYVTDLFDAEDAPYLPTDNFAWISSPSRSSKSITEVLLYGTRVQAETLVSSVWRRNIDSNGIFTGGWEYFPATLENINPAPALRCATLLPYDKGYLLVGVNKDDKMEVKYSSDRGRTWRKHPYLVLSKALQDRTVTSLKAGVDAHSNLWLLIDEAEVWRGRAHSVDWNEDRRVYED